MKSRHLFKPFARLAARSVTLALAITALQTQAQSWSIDWFTIDGGGGTSTGGVYAVSGTIGQPDAGGPMSGGPYSLIAGFWALPIAVQTMGMPTLTIVSAAPGQATISWTPDTPGFVLQDAESVARKLDQLSQQCDQSRHDSGSAAKEILPAFQAVNSSPIFAT
jgi:hypothetical protein